MRSSRTRSGSRHRSSSPKRMSTTQFSASRPRWMTSVPRHFLRDDDLAPDELLAVLDLADELKADRHRHQPLAGPKSVALVFDKQTLRTQLSFSVGVAE